jgi:bifunctional non-homologous end joining protein LigD
VADKIVRSVRLYNDHNGSDKVINMRILETEGGFLMNYENGPNGGTMMQRTKTDSPVTFAQAEKEWDKLFKSKVKPNEYRVDEVGAADSNYAAPVFTKTSSGKATMMLNEVKDDNHRESLLNNPNVVVQEKFDGVFLKTIVSDDKVIGSNKKGIVLNVTDAMAKSLTSLGKNFECDGEKVGDHFYIFDLPSIDGKASKKKYEDRHQALFKMGIESEFIHIVSSSGTDRASKIAKINEIKTRSGEGVVFKYLDAEYEAGMSEKLFKDKFTATATVCVLEHNKGVESVMIGAYDDKGAMKTMNSLSTPLGKPPVMSIIEVEYLYANPNTDALQQAQFKSMRPEQDLTDCTLSQLKYKTPLDHGLFSVVSSSENSSSLIEDQELKKAKSMRPK